ncbi:MAG TPA: EAL domain-containing protein [Streptosporangiaceae bacterium]|nr:EAL domain-containing protein [Streptosporangiaceae bacterium]
MSPAGPAWTIAGILLAAAAVALLLRRSRSSGPAYRWLAAAAAAWGAAFAAQVAAVGSVMPAAVELSLTDLLAMAGLVPLAIGVCRLAPGGRPAGSVSRLADGGLVGLGVFAIAWIAVLRPAYAATAVGPASFSVDLIHPLADLVALGALLPAALRAGRAALAPYLALAAATLGDLVAVQDRAAGLHAGAWPQLAWLLAICLLGAAALPWPPVTVPGTDDAERALPAVPLSTVVGLAVAGLAAVATFIFALVTRGHSGPVPLVASCALAFALVARAAGLLRRSESLTKLSATSGSKFLQLADRTSDVVLLCDTAAAITYASRAIGRYGYVPADLTGRQLSDLLHPDDQGNAARTAAAAAIGNPAQVHSLACRVRAADGTWRHVQATLSRYTGTGRQEALLVTARDVSDQVALRRQVTHLTFHDGLTGLPNRAYLEERVKDLLLSGGDTAAQPERAAAIFVDLDGFTAINDSADHGAGDLLLAEAGRRLRAQVPAHDTVARWGGDEFAILIEHAARPQDVVDIAERLAGAIAATPFRVADRDITMTASLGVAFADSDLAEHLLRNADLAMARAKEAGGGRVEVFAAHMHADVIRRLELAAALRETIAAGALRLEYQPLVELATSRVAGVEALVRWSWAGEQVPPAEFLSVAEESGLIVALGEWVLRTACQQVADWRAGGWQVGLSVNCSLRQAGASGFAESVLTALDDCGLPRSALTLELTERMLIDAPEPMLEELARLRALGIRLAIDDFGTGYASLAYLRQLPVDIIKIDPSFVAGLGTDGTLAMLTRTIVQVGHDLGIEIVAEGIERPEQLELLRAMGCGLGQGFLVARPMTVQAIESLPESGGRRAVVLGTGQAGPTPGRPPADAEGGPDELAPATPPAGRLEPVRADTDGLADTDSDEPAAAPAG